ncbi:Glutaredoxin 4 [Buchnera aphidicola (Cinara cf. splendens/pseudotsugae 3390)]|uniref:Glutaredoxin n=1 Tax=Buchnera aphidicola (Cinara cf. splendens/pseudotsugae 3390) TaxID=2518980 RepID=A0A451CX60_9GAMM|nr:Glutaredoxin 4 [Buchnera aphidicola (Cinara cf. splendens/pseudotsugae 3390)]
MIDAIRKIKKQLKKNIIVLYMKGSPEHPSCGFSARAVQALSSCTSNFFYVDILKDTDIRLALPKYSKWPTFPQLWIKERLIGGCDIMLELLNNGELLNLIQNCQNNTQLDKSQS